MEPEITKRSLPLFQLDNAVSFSLESLMANLLRLMAIVAIGLLGTSAFAQNAIESGTPSRSEDQMIAEAIWSLLNSGASDPVDIQSAFDDASEAFPQSAKVAYWRGRFSAYASGRYRVLKKLTIISGKLAEPQPDNAKIADPTVERKLSYTRSIAKRIGELFEHQAKDQSALNTKYTFEVSLLNAASLDTTLVAAWAGLMESSDTTIALTAADAWAKEEPDNALPLYAKAVVLTRDRKRDDPIDIEAIAALERGNRRPECRAPDEPWPVNFSLSFPNSLPNDVAEFEGKPVTPQMLRKCVEGMFSQFDAIGGGAAVSESAISGLGGSMLFQSHRLSCQEKERYLRAFAGVGVHLVQSNRLLYGITAGNVDNTLNHLETLAVDQGDFESAEEIAGIRDYVFATSKRVAEGYRAAEHKDDSARLDLDANKIMKELKSRISIPQIRFNDEQRASLILGDEFDDDTNMVVFDLFYSNEREVFVRRIDQRSPNEEMNNAELLKRGYTSLEQSIDDVRKANRQTHRSRGIFLVVNNWYMSNNIAIECFSNGYIGKRDPCIIAFTAGEDLERFRESYPDLDVRIAQILGTGDKLGRDDFKEISKKADLVVVPATRLFQDDGQLTPYASSANLKFIATASRDEQSKIVDGVECIVGTAPLNLLSSSEQDDEP